jgi:hypothetical protein
MRPFPNLPSGGLATKHDQRPPDPALCFATKSLHVGIKLHFIRYPRAPRATSNHLTISLSEGMFDQHAPHIIFQ